MNLLHLFSCAATLMFSCLSCSNEKDIKKEGIEIKEVIMTHTSEEPVIPPPPPTLGSSEYTSKFKTLKEWFFHLCDAEKPQQDSLSYDFGIYQTLNPSTNEPTDECMISLVGSVTYNENPNHSVTKIKFEPKEMFFTLPIEDCEGLTLTQIQSRVIKQLTEFTRTEKFKHSFFQNAKEIELSGRKIWPE